MIPVFTARYVDQNDMLSDIEMVSRIDGAIKRLKRGSSAWRIIHFTGFCSCSEIPWDVQVDIQNLVWDMLTKPL